MGQPHFVFKEIDKVLVGHGSDGIAVFGLNWFWHGFDLELFYVSFFVQRVHLSVTIWAEGYCILNRIVPTLRKPSDVVYSLKRGLHSCQKRCRPVT